MSSIGWHHFATSTWMVPGGNSSRRRELNAKKELPAISEIQARLGAPLAHIFLQSMTESTARNQLGLEPPLKGPKQELWVSPSDILQGKFVLTVPNTIHCRQALTHQSILNLGAQYELALEVETQKRIKTTIEDAEKRMKYQKEEAVDIAIQKTKLDEQERYKFLLASQQKHTDEIIQKSIANVRESLIAEAEAQKEEALRLLREDMENQMVTLIKVNETYIKKQYNFKLQWESNKCFENFQERLIQQQKKWAALFEEVKYRFQKELDRIRFDLDAKHVTDTIRIYQEAQLEINTLKEEVNKNIIKLRESNDIKIQKKEATITQNIVQLKEKDNKIKILKEKLHDLAIEFQKFIQFILQQKPSQGQYLLSLEEIMKDNPLEELKYDDNDEDGKETPSKNTLPKDKEGTVYLVMALIIETLMNTKNSTIMEEKVISEITGENTLSEEEFEKQVEHERKANRAVDIISGDTKSHEDSQSLPYLKERLDAVKDVFNKYPSIMKLFLATKSSIIQTRVRSYQHKHYERPSQ